MRMEVNVVTSQIQNVDIDMKALAGIVSARLLRSIRPELVSRHDSWHLDSKNHLIGVTEYYHGSDSYTDLGPADEGLVEKYLAIKWVCEKLGELK